MASGCESTWSLCRECGHWQGGRERGGERERGRKRGSVVWESVGECSVGE